MEFSPPTPSRMIGTSSAGTTGLGLRLGLSTAKGPNLILRSGPLGLVPILAQNQTIKLAKRSSIHCAAHKNTVHACAKRVLKWPVCKCLWTVNCDHLAMRVLSRTEKQTPPLLSKRHPIYLYLPRIDEIETC